MDTVQNQDKEIKSSDIAEKVETDTAKSATKKRSDAKGTSTAKKAIKKTSSKKRMLPIASKKTNTTSNSPYPRHTIEKSLRIPKAILEQNAGKECSESEAAKFIGLSSANGPFRTEISSSIKYGLLERPSPKNFKTTDLAKRILRPQSSNDEIQGLQQAVLSAPVIGEVYKHYRGENIPDRQFFENALVDTFKVPRSNVAEFISIFNDNLEYAKLLEKVGDKIRVIDISSESKGTGFNPADEIKRLSKGVSISEHDSCFVMMPFASPLGDYYSKIYEPAIRKAGLIPVRADDDIFGTGKIIDQVWSGINNAKVLIAELTTRNPNVFYELGLAHALKKPVVLVSSNMDDVPFDLKHIRVIYYEKDDPFWGNKLIDKVAENILSAISNPEETVLFQS